MIIKGLWEKECQPSVPLPTMFFLSCVICLLLGPMNVFEGGNTLRRTPHKQDNKGKLCGV